MSQDARFRCAIGGARCQVRFSCGRRLRSHGLGRAEPQGRRLGCAMNPGFGQLDAVRVRAPTRLPHPHAGLICVRLGSTRRQPCRSLLESPVRHRSALSDSLLFRIRCAPRSNVATLCDRQCCRFLALTLGFGTEASLFQRAGISTVVCGPGFADQAHQADAFFSLAQRAHCERLRQGLASA